MALPIRIKVGNSEIKVTFNNDKNCYEVFIDDQLRALPPGISTARRLIQIYAESIINAELDKQLVGE